MSRSTFNGPRTWPSVIEFLKQKGPQPAAPIAYYLASEGLQSNTVGYSKGQRQLIDHVRLTLNHAVKMGILKFDEGTLKYNV
jgi:hypothetical protein